MKTLEEYTQVVHTFEYLPSKAFEHLDYIKTRENRVYVLDIIQENNKAIIIENEEKNGTNLSFSVRKIDDEEVTNLNNLKVSNISNSSSNLAETEKNENKDKKKESERQDTQNGITLELPYIYYLGTIQ